MHLASDLRAGKGEEFRREGVGTSTALVSHYSIGNKPVRGALLQDKELRWPGLALRPNSGRLTTSRRQVPGPHEPLNRQACLFTALPPARSALLEGIGPTSSVKSSFRKAVAVPRGPGTTIDVPRMSASDRLSLTFRAINDVPDSNTGICLTSIVFGVHPKLPKSGNRGSMAERARIITDCTKLAVKMKARSKIKERVRKYYAPNVQEVEKIRRLPPGTEVLVFREKYGWKKYKVAAVEENNVEFVLPSKNISPFGIHCARQLFDAAEMTASESKSEENCRAQIEREKSEKSAREENLREDFTSSRLDELKVLEMIGKYEVVKMKEP